MASEQSVLMMNMKVEGNAETPEKKEISQPEYLREFVDPGMITKWTGDDGNLEALQKAIELDDIEMQKEMLVGGAPYLFRGKNDDEFLLKEAILRNNTVIIQIILKKHQHEGTPEDEEEYQRQILEALKTTCQTNDLDIARLLLQETTNGIPEEYLNEAAKSGSTSVLAELLTTFPHMDIHVRDINGNSPLHNAVERSHIHTVQYLLNRGAKPNLTNTAGYNCVHLACRYADQDILYLLTTSGGDVNAKGDHGKTPTMIAVENGKDTCMHILAAAGANLHERDSEGNVPLVVAAGNGYTSIVRELILNGASFDLKNELHLKALEKALDGHKDETAAMIIHLSPEKDYVGKYLSKVMDYGGGSVRSIRPLTKTIKAILDKTVVKSDLSSKHEAVVNTKCLQIDDSGNTPNDTKFEKSFVLQDIAGLEDEEIAYHGTIRLLVDRKMKQFGNRSLLLQIFFVLFFLFLTYSLVVLASYRPIDLSEYTNGAENIIRIVAELYVLLYFLFNLFIEAVEFLQIQKRVYISLIKYIKEKWDYGSQLVNITLYFMGIIITFGLGVYKYFKSKSNIWDFLGIFTLFILILLRASSQPTQWIFATLTFIINGLRLFKLLALSPTLGPYSSIVYKILVNDVPLFSSLFLLTLFIFTGGFFISLRTPYTSSGFTNASLMDDTFRVRGVDNEVQWVFLSGIRVLLEGNIYEGEYLFQQLNWLAASIYLGFLFLIAVVYLNLFIAQLSDRYSTVKVNAEKTFAKNRLDFIVQVECTSLYSLFVDCCRKKEKRNQYYLETIEISKQELIKYYGVNSVKSLSVNSLTQDANEKDILASIKNQLVVTRNTEEILKFTLVNTNQPGIVQEMSGGQDWKNRMLKEMEQMATQLKELQLRDAKLLEKMQRRDAMWQEKLEQSNLALLGLIERKLK